MENLWTAEARNEIKIFVGRNLLIRTELQPTDLRKYALGILKVCLSLSTLKFLKPTGHVMHHQFNIQQLYVLPTLYLCVLCLSENKQRVVPLTA